MITNNLRFPGQYYDAESGLSYNYFRDYNPAIGRYVEVDPIGLGGGINPYIYVRNNPQNLTDPSGLTSDSSGVTNSCWVKCLSDDPLFTYLAPLSLLPNVNLKLPSEVRPGASRFTTIDRRLPSWTGANPDAGATVSRGSLNRVKFCGRLGTAAAVIGTFATSYSATAMTRCWLECR